MKTIQDLIAHVTSECTAIDREARFNDMLDEAYSFEKVGGPFANMSPSRVLLECDPVAHRCGVNDYMDGEDVTEIESECYEDSEIDAAREAFVDGLNTELSDLQSELDAEQDAEDEIRDGDEVTRLTAEIANLEAFIAACEKYVF